MGAGPNPFRYCGEYFDVESGAYYLRARYKERVDFGRVIGQYYDQETGQYVDTTIGIIHYGNDGAHIIPAKP